MDKEFEALKYVNGIIIDLEDDLQHYTMVDKDKAKELFIREDLKQFALIKQVLIKAQEIEDENNILLGQNTDLFDELALANKQYKELMEGAKRQNDILKIMFDKNVDIELLKQSEDRSEYNTHFPYRETYQLTQEEFDLLTGWLKAFKISKGE